MRHQPSTVLPINVQERDDGRCNRAQAQLLLTAQGGTAARGAPVPAVGAGACGHGSWEGSESCAYSDVHRACAWNASAATGSEHASAARREGAVWPTAGVKVQAHACDLRHTYAIRYAIRLW